ncbi:MAG: hypothetical protein HYY00_04645 [Chloroflexi bacterium]|nr:hypothetical protein [Chloroflexota bacterium]
MRPNRAKRKIKAGQVALGCFVHFTAPNFVEACAAAGVDYVMFDCEHWDITLDGMVQMVRAAELYDITCTARIPLHDRHLISQALDAGLQGVMVPHCNTAEDARAVVNIVKFPPMGHRGIHARGRPTRMGTSMATAEYVRAANEETLVICMCEEMTAVKNLDSIIAVPGVDVIEIGPGDLGASMGYPPRAEVDRVCDEVYQKLRQAGVPWGRAGVTLDPESLRTLASKGGRYLTIGATELVMSALRPLVETVRSLNASAPSR